MYQMDAIAKRYGPTFARDSFWGHPIHRCVLKLRGWNFERVNKSGHKHPHTESQKLRELLAKLVDKQQLPTTLVRLDRTLYQLVEYCNTTELREILRWCSVLWAVHRNGIVED